VIIDRSMMVRVVACFVFLPLSGPAASGRPVRLAYPVAARGEVVDDYNGVKVADPYRWMEELDSKETRAWVSAEAALTDSYLAGVSARPVIEKRLTQLLDHEKFGLPFHRRDRYFYTHNSGLQPQSVLYVTRGLKGEPRVAFDPNLLSTNGSVSVAGYAASPDGALLLYGVTHGGSDWTEWHFRKLATGKDLPDIIRWVKYYHPVFSPDGKGVYYSAFPAPKAGEELRVRDLGNAVYYHRIGSRSADVKILERPDHTDWQFQPHLTANDHWLVVTVGEGEVGDKGLESVYAINLASKSRTVVPLAEGFDAAYLYVGSDQGQLYFQTTLGAPRGRVIAIDPISPDRYGWRQAVPQGQDAMDFASTSVTLVDHKLIVRTLHDAHSKVSIYALDSRRLAEVPLAGFGTASGFGGEPGDEETFYTFTDFITPPTSYRLDLRTGKSELFRSPKVAFESDRFQVDQVFFNAKDGVRIPMYLVHEKGLSLNGQNPTLLYGYGGFGIPSVPRFDATRLVWLERGGIFAVANIRGGGEYGEEWHRQAIRARKQVVFDDFIAAAEWLVSEKYTSTPRLAIEGGSNGGLLVGACLTQRPDLFGAALAYVGVMDMLRFDLFGQGAGWVGDYGSPRNPEDFGALRAYSPVHNVHSGTRYPATLVITGDHDARVMPAHSFKFAAALQAAQEGSAPVLLRVRRDTGHGSGATTRQLIAEKTDAYSFLLENLMVMEK
jgi:prolyl oligopeptidase